MSTPSRTTSTSSPPERRHRVDDQGDAARAAQAPHLADRVEQPDRRLVVDHRDRGDVGVAVQRPGDVARARQLAPAVTQHDARNAVQRRDLVQAVAERAVRDHQQLLARRHDRRDRHLHRRGARAGQQQHLVGGRRAERGPQLFLQAADDGRVVTVAVTDVVVNQRRLHARRRHHRARAEQHVPGLVLLGEQPLDQLQRAGRRRRRRRLHRRARQLVAVHAQQPLGVQLHLGAVQVLPKLGADVVRDHQAARGGHGDTLRE